MTSKTISFNRIFPHFPFTPFVDIHSTLTTKYNPIRTHNTVPNKTEPLKTIFTQSPPSNSYFSKSLTSYLFPQTQQEEITPNSPSPKNKGYNTLDDTQLAPASSINNFLYSLPFLHSFSTPLLDEYYKELFVNFFNMEQHFFDRLSYCPARTYAFYYSPTPNLLHLSFINEIRTIKQLRTIKQYKIFLFSDEQVKIICPNGLQLLLSNSDFIRFKKYNFKYKLEEFERYRHKKISQPLFSDAYYDSSSSKTHIFSRMNRRKQGTFVFSKISNNPYEKKHNLFYVNIKNQVVNKIIIFQNTGLLQVDDLIFQDFDSFYNYFQLTSSLLQQEINERNIKQHLEDLTKENDEKTTDKRTPRFVISESGQIIYYPKPLRPRLTNSNLINPT